MRGHRLPGKLTTHMYTRDAIQAGMDSSPAASRAGVWIGALFFFGTLAWIVASILGWV